MKPAASLLFAALALVTAIASPVAQAQTTAAPGELSGTWVNPRGSVKVKTGECGTDVCGWIVWANDQAMSDAREAGVDKLVGTMLLKDYRTVSPDHWEGHVYVPDMGGTYFSRMERLDPEHLKISGCVLGGWICKSQVWLKD